MEHVCCHTVVCRDVDSGVMMIATRKYREDDVPAMRVIWNEVVAEGVAFPQLETLDAREALEFFAAQTSCGVAVREDGGQVLGLFIVHPNNVGRCGHIANASYAVSSAARGQHAGRALVLASLEAAREAGFRIMQFNAVVASNEGARHLYESIGFKQLGTIPGGFHMPDGSYEDICPYYYVLV